LAGSIALHGFAAALVMLVSIRMLSPSAPEPVAITMVFEPTEAPAAPPVPEPAAAPPPAQPEPPAEPPQPPEPQPVPPAPAPPQATTVPDEPPPPPPTPTPEIEPLPLPPPPPPRPPAQPRSPPAHARSLAPTPPQAPASQNAAPAAAPAAPAPAAAPPPPSVISGDWQRSLNAWLQAHKTYPEEAKRRGDEGRAIVRFTVDRDGSVLSVELVSSTGSTLLDAAVEQLLRGAHLPAFPPAMTEAAVTVSLQIRYSLER
jgi:protein TonB